MMDGSQLLTLDAADFARSFSREPFLVGHQLADHPLFTMDRLLELCRTLPSESVEYNAGDIPKALRNEETPLNGLSAEETVRRIAECKSWLVMKHVEADPAYRELLDDCLDAIAPLTEPIAPGMASRQAFIFVTSPGSVTPYHIDPEHNFLLQVRGEKHVTMFDGRDRSILRETDLEQMYMDAGRNLPFEEEWEQRAWKFTLQPGEGLHFPVTYPHYVRNGEAVSISLSITFRTPDLDRRRMLYRRNAAKRAAGQQPTPVGSRPLVDSLLWQSTRVLRKVGLGGDR